MFKFICFYNCAGSIQSGPRDEERKKRRQLLLLQGKETEDCAALLSFPSSPSSCSSFFPTSPTTPSGSGSIMTSPRDRRGRGQGTSFSEEQKTKDHAAFSLLASPSTPPLSFPSFPSHSSCYPALCPDVCLVASPDGLIVAFFPSGRPPARLPRCVR